MSAATFFGTGPNILDSPNFALNYSLSAASGSSALTLTLNTSAGTTPSGAYPVQLGFRSSTATTGTYSQVNATASTTMVIPDATGLALTTGTTIYLFVYALNNAGTIELAVSGSSYFDEVALQTTTAVSGGANFFLLYSTTARSNVAIRFLGRIAIVLASGNHWATNPVQVSLLPCVITKQRVIGTPQTALGSVTNTSFTTPTNAPAVTLTAQRSTQYKIWANLPIDSQTNGATVSCQIAATSGSPSVSFTQEGPVLAVGSVPAEGIACPFLLCNLVAGSTYTFSLQLKASSGPANVRSDQTTTGCVLVAEEV